MSNTAVVRLETYYIVCACGAVESMMVAHFTEVYREINRLGWGLIPTQHAEQMKGLVSRLPREGGQQGEREQ